MHFSLTWNKCNHKLRYLQLIFSLDCMQMNFFSLFSLWKINNNLTDFLLKTKDQKIWYSTSFHCLSMQFLKYHICKVLSSALLAHNLGKTSISDVTWDTLLQFSSTTNTGGKLNFLCNGSLKFDRESTDKGLVYMNIFVNLIL